MTETGLRPRWISIPGAARRKFPKLRKVGMHGIAISDSYVRTHADFCHIFMHPKNMLLSPEHDPVWQAAYPAHPARQ